MQIKTRLLLALVICALPVGLPAQLSPADSLRSIIRSSGDDTIVINAKIALAAIYRKSYSNDTAIQLASEAITLSRDLHYVRGEGTAAYQLGVAYAQRGDRLEAMRNLERSIVLLDTLGELRLHASAVQAMSVQYQLLGDYPSALRLALQAIKMKQQLGDSTAMSGAYSVLGLIYSNSDQKELALKAYENSLRIDSVSGNMALLARSYYNCANVCANMKNDSLAIYYLNESMVISNDLKLTDQLGYCYALMGRLLGRQNKLEEARAAHEKGLEYAGMIQDPVLILSEKMFLGGLAGKLGEFEKAEAILLECVEMGRKLDLKYSVAEAYDELSNLYEGEGKYKEALLYSNKFNLIYDSLYNDSKKDELNRIQLSYAFERQRDLDLAEQDKNNALYEEDRKRKQLIIYSGAGFIILVLAFLIFVYSRYRVSQKQKALIAAQKNEVEIQKQLIEDRNKSITDSINYAQRIQKAILPDDLEFNRLLPDSFLLYLPKDIVSGDFYWIAESQDYIFYATADCTGHGVPGGFMSMLGASLLNEIVTENKVTEPAGILLTMRERIIAALKQKGESGENKDGMDMVLCRLSRNSRSLVFAAANNPLWVMRNGELIEFGGDKQAVGIGEKNAAPFRQQEFVLEPNDVIYTFTDGYADQFGGEKGKKYKYGKLKTLLKDIHSLDTQKQKDCLQKEFNSWRGNLEQVDDVLMIGVRI